MKKILLALLCLPSIALAAQQEITAVPDSPVLPSIGALKDAVNLRLADIDENFDELYPIISAGPVYVNASAPADTKVVWIDTDQDNAIKVRIGDVWTVVGSGGEGSYTLPTAAADTLGGVKVGARLTITDGVLSADVQTTDISGKENSLGNPSTSGYVLSSTTSGVRSWIEMTGGGTGIAHATSDGNYYASKDGGWASLAGVFLTPTGSADSLTNFPTLNQNTTGTAGGLSGTPNITVGTISAGAAGFNVDADGDVTAKSVTVTRTTIPSAIDLYEGTSGGDNKLTLTLSGNLAADVTLNADQILVDGDIGSTVQGYDADLATAAGASAAGVSKYFGTNASSVVGFYDLPSGGGTPTTITVADTTDTTAYVALFDSATGDLGPKTDGGITYNAGTGVLTATGFSGPLTGTASGNLTASSESTLTNKTLDTAATGNAITVPLNGVLDGAITDPADADDMIYAKAPNALTITDIHCLAEGGGTITLTLQECTAAGASCANIEGAITCDADGAEDDGTLTDGAIASGAWIKVLYSAPTGTVNNVAWTVYGTQTW